MTINDFAKKLDGRKYRMEMYQVEANQAKQLGFVVLYGYLKIVIDYVRKNYDMKEM
jgi:hypothetical protein